MCQLFPPSGRSRAFSHSANPRGRISALQSIIPRHSTTSIFRPIASTLASFMTSSSENTVYFSYWIHHLQSLFRTLKFRTFYYGQISDENYAGTLCWNIISYNYIPQLYRGYIDELVAWRCPLCSGRPRELGTVHFQLSSSLPVYLYHHWGWRSSLPGQRTQHFGGKITTFVYYHEANWYQPRSQGPLSTSR